MSKIRLEVIQPTGKKIDSEFDHIVLPGVDGDFGISPDHTSLITQLRPGVAQCFINNDLNQVFAIHDGFVTVEKNHIIVLCENIEGKGEIDENRAKQALERAEQRLAQKQEGTDFRRAEYALQRAIARIHAVEGL